MPLTAARPGRPSDAELLRPYVPRLLVDWLRSTPDATRREIEGTLAFVDISGFTQLTERLARKGRIGAEEMSDTLSAVFSGLLAIAYDDGAGLVKWGGDAVLLLFEGADHQARAARAAFRMRAALRILGRVETTAGRVSLRMSVGIHSGLFHFFLVGDPARHRELLVAGPASTTTAQVEGAATAGEIGLSPVTAQALPRRLVRARPDGLLLLAGQPVLGSEPAPPSPDPSGLDLGVALSAPMRAHLLAGGGEPEHRHVAVAFVRFAGTDQVLQADGPDALAEALDECVRNVQEACERHGVTFFETDIDADGGKIMLVAGAPTSADRNEERMLLATRLVLDRPGRLPLRIGVNAGPVFSGDFGPPFRRTYSVKGDAINLAARVMGKASPGQLLATTTTTERSAVGFTSEAMPPFLVKGKARPVTAVSVGEPLRVEQADAAVLPMVGRERETARLAERLDAARKGDGSLVQVVGEPGIGKSRLVRETAAAAERSGDVRVVAVRCDEYESSTPYHPVQVLLRAVLDTPAGMAVDDVRARVETLAGDEDPGLLPWLPLLGVPLDLAWPPTRETAGLDEQFRKARVEEVTRRLLATVLRDPTLVVVEDAHLMDDASADLMAGLADDAAQRPWLLLVTRRDQQTGFVPAATRAVTLRPQPIDAAAAASLAGEAATLAPHQIDAIVRRAGGNPLFLGSLLAAARSGVPLDALPDSVESLLTAQVDRLPSAERGLLRYASVLGVSFSEQHLRHVLGPEGPPTGRESLLRLREFMEPAGHGRFRFKHALVRDAAYEGLSYRRRRELHGRVGDMLAEEQTGEPEPELLSYHYFHAGKHREAWHWSRTAGDRARRRYAYADAADLLRRAVESVRRLPAAEAPAKEEVAEVFVALGDVETWLGDPDDARRAFRAARRLDLPPVATAELLLKEARLDMQQGRPRASMRLMTRGLRALEADRTPATLTLVAQTETFYAYCVLRQGRPREASRRAYAAVERARESGDLEALGTAYAMLQEIAKVSSYAHDQPYGLLALELFEQIGDVVRQGVVRNNLAGDLFVEGRWSEAAEMFARARSDSEQVGDAVGVATATYNQAEIIARQGAHDAAEDAFRRVRATAEAVGDVELYAYTVRELGRLGAIAGRSEEASGLLAEARAVFDRAGDVYEVLGTHVEEAEAALRAGEPRTALRLCDEVEQRARDIAADALLPSVHRIRGTSLLVLGDPVGAVQELNTALAEVEGSPYDLGLTLLALADALDASDDPAAADVRARGERALDQLGAQMIRLFGSPMNST